MNVLYQGKNYELSDSQLSDYCSLSELNGHNAVIFTRGDRKVRATFENLLWSIQKDKDGLNIVVEEDIEDFDMANRMEIPVSSIKEIKLFDEEMDGDSQYYIVFILTTGNELHIHSLVA